MKCTLCPRCCGADREKGQRGFCGAGSEVRIARAALHFWEEPCISGTEGSGTVFFSHCTMQCVFCQNREISAGGKGFVVTESELAEKFLELQRQGANNINLVTPTHYVPQIIRALILAKDQGLHLPVVYNTGGYERVETLRMLEGIVDVYMPDLKYYSDRYAVQYSAAPDYFKITAAAIREMYRQVGAVQLDERGMMKRGVLVRHLMLPGLLFDTKKIIDYLEAEYGDRIYISLMNQYTPMPAVRNVPALNRRLGERYYETMLQYCMDKGMENVFIQEGETAKESFIPAFFGDVK